MIKILALALTTALALAGCGDGHDSYDFQPETKEKVCGIVTYNDPDKDDGDVPLGRYCLTDRGER